MELDELKVVRVNDVQGTLEDWQREAEILVTARNVIVHFEIETRKGKVNLFLRRHRGDGSHFWDYQFGDDYGTAERAMEALLTARSPLSTHIAEKMVLRRAV